MKKYIVIAMLLLVLLTSCVNQTELDPKLKEIKDRGKLIVGSDIPYGVMEFFDDSGNVVGIDVDIAREIADYLGVELEMRDIEWDQLFIDAKSNEIDLAISAITITSERAEKMLFSIPYFDAGQILIVQKDNQDITGPLNLQGLKIGVQIKTTGETEAKKYTDENNIKTYLSYECTADNECMLDDLKTGKIDAIIMDYVAAIVIVSNEEELKILGEPFTEEFYGVVTAIGNDALLNEVNTVLRDIKRTGRLTEIINKWSE